MAPIATLPRVPAAPTSPRAAPTPSRETVSLPVAPAHAKPTRAKDTAEGEGSYDAATAISAREEVGGKIRRAEAMRGKWLLARPPSAPEPLPRIIAKGGSISDSIRKLSGKPYDVYRDIFLEKVRDSIHKALLANQTRSHGIFDTSSNEAEDQVFGFVSAHYDDPFMDWEASAEKAAIEALGFSLPSLDPIVEACFRRL